MTSTAKRRAQQQQNNDEQESYDGSNNVNLVQPAADYKACGDQQGSALASSLVLSCNAKL